MGRQGLEALPCLHVPYAHALVKLKAKGQVTAALLGGTGGNPPAPSPSASSLGAPTPAQGSRTLTEPETMRLDWGLKLQQKT